jgi:hypothetical protein
MSDTSSRNIERLLQAAAEKRRQESGGPFELHPATRRLLQGEVARTRRAAPRRAGLGGAWWPAFVRHRFGLALTASLLLVAGITRLVLWPPAHNASREMSEAETGTAARKIDLASEKKALPSPPAPTTPAPASAPTFARPADPQTDSRSFALDAPQPASTVSARVVTLDALAKDKSASPSPILPTPGEGTRPTAGTSRAFKQEPASLPVLNQNFRRANSAPAKAARAPSAAEPLASFQFVQSGSQLQVIDSDGSAYTGSIQVANAPVATATPRAENTQLRARATARADRSPAVAATGSQAGSKAGGGGRQVAQPDASSTVEETVAPAQAYSFRVVGANRTLNQNVLFTGQLHLPANAAMNQAFTANSASQQLQEPAANASQRTAQNTVSQSASNQASPSQSSLPLGQSRISGEVRVGDRPPVPLEAQPLGP